MNPWNYDELQEAKLLDIDYINMIAEVQIGKIKINIPIEMDQQEVDEILEIGHYYGGTAFLNEYGGMVAYSHLSIWNGTLTPAPNGGVIYE